jgi:3-deoxy-D-manno-octulosonate 8-phosphate phosphatase (KDO 8-P phosphatase)
MAESPSIPIRSRTTEKGGGAEIQNLLLNSSRVLVLRSLQCRYMGSPSSLSAEDRARRIKLIIFDVDGVLTDGGIWLFPAPAPSTGTANHAAEMESKGGYAFASQSMVEAKGFNAHDGTGVSLARLGGMKCAIITKRISETVALRARDLRLEYVYMGQAYKMKAVREIMEKESISLEEVCYVGDDVIDLPVMRVCGFAVAVANARDNVKSEAHYVTPHGGGHGAARDAIEFILAAKGILQKTIDEYIDERNPLPANMDIGRGGF